MLVFWLAVRVPIARRFAHNIEPDRGARHSRTCMMCCFPTTGRSYSALVRLPALLCVDGAEAARPEDERLLLACCAALCVPVVLYFGVWTETRLWLEWTLPLAVMGATEAMRWMQERTMPGAACTRTLNDR